MTFTRKRILHSREMKHGIVCEEYYRLPNGCRNAIWFFTRETGYEKDKRPIREKVDEVLDEWEARVSSLTKEEVRQAIK